ncbi:MAG: sigma-54-dependent Fis family transcriptional regulator [Marivivens sp.]|nr:sigma-54-dependent Fis family transcriptional regulator [Marivivens sp.]
MSETIFKTRSAEGTTTAQDAKARTAVSKSSGHPRIVGNSPQIETLRSHLATIGPSDAPILVRGETGTGKELVAQALHAQSGRSGELVSVNCAAIPAELLESELFGHEKGAFTGADARRIGRIEQANGGTLFLDEIGDMPLELQAKLLRVLESRRIRRVGAAAEVDVDFRLVTATHQDLDKMIAQSDFRADLYFRIAVFALELPSLKERINDLPLILEELIRQYCDAHPNAEPTHYDPTGVRALCAYSWPGNIRELRNVMIRAMVLFPGRMINGTMVRESLLSQKLPNGMAVNETPAALPEAQGLPDPTSFKAGSTFDEDLDLRRYLRDIEISLIEAALLSKGGCVSQAADALRLRRTTLIEKMRKYGLKRDEITFVA